MKLVLALAVGASAFGASASPPRRRRRAVARWRRAARRRRTSRCPRSSRRRSATPGASRNAARAEAKKAEAEAQLIPTPARFAFAFGRPDILAERRAERLAKWQWSDEFLAKARPDQGNYGQGDVFDDGLTKLERLQIEQGREARAAGGASSGTSASRARSRCSPAATSRNFPASRGAGVRHCRTSPTRLDFAIRCRAPGPRTISVAAPVFCLCTSATRGSYIS